MSLLDPRLAVALSDDGSARTLLADLHQQVLSCRDPRTLAELLGKYVVAAAARQTLPAQQTRLPMRRLTTSQSQMDAQRYQTISNISRAAHDAATSSITNIKP